MVSPTSNLGWAVGRNLENTKDLVDQNGLKYLAHRFLTPKTVVIFSLRPKQWDFHPSFRAKALHECLGNPPNRKVNELFLARSQTPEFHEDAGIAQTQTPKSK